MLLFLGAGASRPFGIPTTFEFPKLIYDHVRGRLDVEQQYMWRRLEELFSDRFDLEVLLTVADDLSKDYAVFRSTMASATAELVLEGGYKQEEIKKLVERGSWRAVSEAIRDYLRNRIVDQTNSEVDHILQVYDRFFGLLAEVTSSSNRTGDQRALLPGELHVFTTNYDRILETYFYHRRTDFDTGVKRLAGKSVLDVRTIPQDQRLVLCKIHGSIDWYYTTARNIVEWDYPITQKQQMKTAMMPLGESIADEVLIYPTETGGDRRITQSPFADLYQIFRTQIPRKKPIVFVGFSFREMRISGILEDVIRWSNDQNTMKILLVDPNAKRIQEQVRAHGYEALASAIRPVPIGFDDGGLKSVFLPASRQ